MCLIADGMCIRSCCCDQEIEWLHSRVTGALRHYIEQHPVGLGMQLVKYHTMDIKPIKNDRMNVM